MKSTTHLLASLLTFGVSSSLSASLHAAVITTSYGYSFGLANTFIPMTPAGPFVPGIQQWSSPSSIPATVRFNPGSVAIYDGASIVFDAHILSLHPGEATEYATVRLTSSGPSQTFAFNGGFWGQDIFNTTTDVHVLKNGTAIFNDNVNGFGLSSEKFFNLNVTMNPGDTLDFAVGYGTSGYTHDSTALELRYAVVPEPSAVLLLGLTGAAALRRRRKQPTA